MANITKSKQHRKFSWKQLYDIVSMCFFMFIFVIVGHACFTFFNSKQKIGTPLVFGYTIIEISSESMLDAGFKEKDKAFIKHTKTNQYQVGDYIAFFNYTDPMCPIFSMVNERTKPREKADTKSIVFHEIINIYKDENGKSWYQTKGTNNASPDSNFIYENYVIGKYVNSSVPLVKVISTITSPKGLLWFITLPCSIILFVDVYTFISIILLLLAYKKDPNGVWSKQDSYYLPKLTKEYIQKTQSFIYEDYINVESKEKSNKKTKEYFFMKTPPTLVPSVKLWEGFDKFSKQKIYYVSIYNRIIKTNNQENYLSLLQNIKGKDVCKKPDFSNDFITICDYDNKTYDIITYKEDISKQKELIKNQTFIDSYSNFVLNNKIDFFNKLATETQNVSQAKNNVQQFIGAKRIYKNLNKQEFLKLKTMLNKEFNLYNSFYS